jgi:hypothetical protein
MSPGHLFPDFFECARHPNKEKRASSVVVVSIN